MNTLPKRILKITNNTKPVNESKVQKEREDQEEIKKSEINFDKIKVTNK